MRKATLSPEIHVHPDALASNPSVEKIINMDEGFIHVYLDHPVLGSTLEIFRVATDKKHLSLKAVFPQDMQDPDEIEICKDYYNNYILEGSQTYLDYWSESTGWYLLTKNSEEEI
jgi:hypothetical protein